MTKIVDKFGAKKNNTTLDDVIICPKCGSNNCYRYSTDDINLEVNGAGHYVVDCHCNECSKTFRLYTEFNYSITRAYTR